MADVKWVKITTDMFDNRKIKHLRRLPDGDSIVLIWVMFLTLAGRCNANGLIFLTENIPYTAKMLADELNFEESTVLLAIQSLEQLGMIQTNSEGFLAVTGWAEHQNIDRLSEIREYNRLAKQRSREKQKLLQDANDKSMTSQSCQETDIDIEEDIEEDKEIYIKVVSHLNEKAETKYKPSSSKTQKCIHARLAEGFTLDDFLTVIDKKCAEWIGTDMEKYLRPETLFGTKFESYLNSKTRKVNKNDRDSRVASETQRYGTYL